MLCLLLFIVCICTHVCQAWIVITILCTILQLFIYTQSHPDHVLLCDYRCPYWLLSLQNICTCLLQTVKWSAWLYILDIITFCMILALSVSALLENFRPCLPIHSLIIGTQSAWFVIYNWKMLLTSNLKFLGSVCLWHYN